MYKKPEDEVMKKPNLISAIQTRLNLGSMFPDKNKIASAENYYNAQVKTHNPQANIPTTYNMSKESGSPQQPMSIGAAVRSAVADIGNMFSNRVVSPVPDEPPQTIRTAYPRKSTQPLIYPKVIKDEEPVVQKQVLSAHDSSVPTPPPKVQESLKPEYQKFLEDEIFPITRQYNIPDAVAASQWAMEGGRVTSNAQNNPWGLMSGGKILQYPSMEASTRDYALTIQNILKAKGYDVSNTDAFSVLLALQQGDKPRYEAHNEDQYQYVRNLVNTPEWRTYYR